MKKKVQNVTKLYYTREKMRKLTDILKYRYIVVAISNDCFYHVLLDEPMKVEFEKCELRNG